MKTIHRSWALLVLGLMATTAVAAPPRPLLAWLIKALGDAFGLSRRGRGGAATAVVAMRPRTSNAQLR